jgi:hypothetical protein
VCVQQLGERSWQIWDTVKVYSQTDDNYAVLRREMVSAAPPAIPHLALYLKDLLFIDGAF